MKLFLFFRTFFSGYSSKRSRIKIVICESYKSKTKTVKLVNLPNYFIGQALSWFSAVSYPDRTETAVFRTAGNCLDRSYQIISRVNKTPVGREELIARDASAGIYFLQFSVQGIFNGLAPDNVSASGDYCIGSELKRFFRKNCCMNASDNNSRTPLFNCFYMSIPDGTVACCHSEADYVFGANF